MQLKFLILLLFLIVLPIELASSSVSLSERSIDDLKENVDNNLEERTLVSPHPNVLERSLDNDNPSDVLERSLGDDDELSDTSPANILEKRAPHPYRCGRKCYFHYLPYYYEGYAPCYPNCGCGSRCSRCYCQYTRCKCTRYDPQ